MITTSAKEMLFRTFLFIGFVFSANASQERYALILEDAPVSGLYHRNEVGVVRETASYRNKISAKQQVLHAELAQRNITITGSVDTVANAVFVAASSDQVEELKKLPGVKGVVRLRRYKRTLNRATQLMNAPAGWSILGGAGLAGAGVKIAVLDSGIEQDHPSFQDDTLKMPAGFPLCSPGDCVFTNKKVIVARSYVRQLAAGSGANPAEDSRPDDYSARDRAGHGTAVASCAAGVAITVGGIPISGVAPKAYLGNYKIYGSPLVNDGTSDDVIIQAVEDAYNDGMDIVIFSSGGPAFSGPLDVGADCGNAAGVPCDLSAKVFNDLAAKGLIIVAAAGNDGDGGLNALAFGTLSSPATAPLVIAAGATTNSHQFNEVVNVPGANVPANLSTIAGETGDATVPTGSITWPLRDVTAISSDPLACAPLPAGSLVGTIALIVRGGCTFSAKLSFAENAGALGVIFYMADGSALISPGGMKNSSTPAILISNADGIALKTFSAANPGQTVTLNPGGTELSFTSNLLAYFSSIGPATGTHAIKPDVLAPGYPILMAGETYDPLGELYSSNGFTVAAGTSFTTPLVAGAAALVKQKNPKYSAAQVKAALMNTAAVDVLKDTRGLTLDVRELGAGRADVAAALSNPVTITPASLSFGVLTRGFFSALTQQLTVANGGNAPVTLGIFIVATKPSAGAAIAVNKTSLTLAAGAAETVTVTLSGSVPPAGSYSGTVDFVAGAVTLRVPYLYLVGDGVAADIIALSDGFNVAAGGTGLIAFRLVDSYGVAVSGTNVSFLPRGTATVIDADSKTDANGIAGANVRVGALAGAAYSYLVTAGGLRKTFTGYSTLKPSIPPNGIVNAATFEPGPVAPGSYVTIFGSGLSDYTGYAPAARLPLAVASATVSFDVPPAKISTPGHLNFASPGQVNVQVPWELEGQNTALVKVSNGSISGGVVTLQLAATAPGIFEVSKGAGAVLDAGFKLVSASNPARRGQAIQIFANGLGAVNNPPESGSPASATKLSTTKAVAQVSIGGQQAQVLFSGLAPGFPALYQVNVIVPPNATAGNQPLTISIGGVTSKASGIMVQ